MQKKAKNIQNIQNIQNNQNKILTLHNFVHFPFYFF